MVENEPGVGIDEDPPLVYAEPAEMASPQIPPQPQDEWSCPQCTLLNPARKIYCLACFHRHPDLARTNVGHGSAQNYAYENQEYKEGETYEYDNTCVESTAPFEDGIESTAPFEDNLEQHRADQNIVGGTMDDGLASSENVVPGEEDPFEKKIRRRMRRKKRMVAGGAAGMVAGAVLGGPALVAAGLVGGAVGTRIVSKHKERLKDERLALKRWEAEIGQRVVKP